MISSIFSYIGNLFNDFFDTNYCKNEEKKIMDENLWISNELEKWKLEMYSENINLTYIPNSRIIQKKNELKEEFKKLK
jgi:hypothetical protein